MRVIFSTILLFFAIQFQAQVHSKVKINIEQRSMQELAALGLAVDHGELKRGRSFTSIFSKDEILKIQQAGFSYEIIIDDYSKYLREQYQQHQQGNIIATTRNPEPCNYSEPSFFTVPSPPENFDYGSFMGYLTYQEMLDNLDSMAAKYPDLISVRAPVDTFLTHQGRPIYWVKISDNPNIDEDEPEAYYNAMHHAREPGGMLILIYFMWHILEEYDNNPSIQQLVNSSEFYFIPCLNPDGFIFNINNYNAGGSVLWRKNMRDNGDGSMGVDLNRNYGYEFGYNDNGSSPNSGSNTYRGPHAFSEPETSASRAFCNAHEFRLAINYHTYGQKIIYPWNYLIGEVADPLFITLAEFFNTQTAYQIGTVSETLGYTSNGGADDWMYGEEVEKPAIFSFSPEFGNNGFYPSISFLDSYLEEGIQQMLFVSYSLHSFPNVEFQNEAITTNIEEQELYFSIKNPGIEDGSFTASLIPLSSNFEFVDPEKIVDVVSGQTTEDSLAFDLIDDILSGEEIQFVLSIENDFYSSFDTITIVFSESDLIEVAFFDSFENNNQWNNGLWGKTVLEYYSAPSCMSDSPFGDSYDDLTHSIELEEPISLVDANQAFLTFWTKWEIEEDFDYAQVSISKDGGSTFEPQCGLYTVTGSLQQDFGNPIYEGDQEEWVKEEINLSSYLGEEIILKFTISANDNFNYDGFFFDDLEINRSINDVNTTHSLDWDLFSIKSYPNPSDEFIRIKSSKPIKKAQIIFCNSEGKKVYQREFKQENEFQIKVKDWPGGMYFYELLDLDTGKKSNGKIIVN